jgi:hypothetical protein
MSVSPFGSPPPNAQPQLLLCVFLLLTTKIIVAIIAPSNSVAIAIIMATPIEIEPPANGFDVIALNEGIAESGFGVASVVVKLLVNHALVSLPSLDLTLQ